MPFGVRLLAEIAEELARAVLVHHADQKTISLPAISVSHLENCSDLQPELALGLEGEQRRPGTRRGTERAVDTIRGRFAVGHGSAALGLARSVPDEFRELAEKGALARRRPFTAAASTRRSCAFEAIEFRSLGSPTGQDARGSQKG